MRPVLTSEDRTRSTGIFATNPAMPVLWAGMALVLLGLAPAVGRADVILGNLITAGDGGNVKISATDYEAVSFTMGSQNYLLSDVEIRIRGNGNSSLSFDLRADASGHPSSSALFTFNGESITGFSVNTITFPAGSPFTVTANSQYWLVGLASSGNTNWVDSSPLTNPSGSGATFGQYEQSSNSGVIWTSSPNKPIFQLDGTPLSVGTPEPSSLVLGGTVACVAAAVGWRRRRTRAAKQTVVTARFTDGT